MSLSKLRKKYTKLFKRYSILMIAIKN